MNQSSATNQQIPDRVVGAFLSAVGVALCYWFIVRPYLAMSTGIPSVEFGFKSAVIGPLLLELGLLHLVLGARAGQLLGRTAPASWRTFVIVVAMFAVAFLGWWWLRSQAGSLGYLAG